MHVLLLVKLNAKDNTIIYNNKNQFTEADQVVKKYIIKYGADNITFVGHSLGGDEKIQGN